MTKEPTIITDWLDEHGDPEITRKVEKEAELREAAFKLFPRLINDPYNPMEDDNEEYRDIWIEGAKWQSSQQDQFAIKFGVWLSTNCLQDTSKNGWWLYEKTWLTTDECLLKFKNGNA